MPDSRAVAGDSVDELLAEFIREGVVAPELERLLDEAEFALTRAELLDELAGHLRAELEEGRQQLIFFELFGEGDPIELIFKLDQLVEDLHDPIVEGDTHYLRLIDPKDGVPRHGYFSNKQVGDLRRELRRDGYLPRHTTRPPNVAQALGAQVRQRGSSRQARPARRTSRATARSPGRLSADDDPDHVVRPRLTAEQRRWLKAEVGRLSRERLDARAALDRRVFAVAEQQGEA